VYSNILIPIPTKKPAHTMNTIKILIPITTLAAPKKATTTDIIIHKVIASAIVGMIPPLE
jgi:hypothetical protein